MFGGRFCIPTGGFQRWPQRRAAAHHWSRQPLPLGIDIADGARATAYAWQRVVKEARASSARWRRGPNASHGARSVRSGEVGREARPLSGLPAAGHGGRRRRAGGVPAATQRFPGGVSQRVPPVRGAAGRRGAAWEGLSRAPPRGWGTEGGWEATGGESRLGAPTGGRGATGTALKDSPTGGWWRRGAHPARRLHTRRKNRRNMEKEKGARGGGGTRVTRKNEKK